MDRILNVVRQPHDPEDFRSERHFMAPLLDFLPAEFSVRSIPIYDQGYTGTCVANGCTAAFRKKVFDLTGNYSKDFSRLYVYWNARVIDGGAIEDNGTYVRSGFKAMNKKGLALEGLWPFIESMVNTQPPVEAFDNGLLNLVVEYARVGQTEEELKRTIYSGAVIPFGMEIYQSFDQGNWDRTSFIIPKPSGVLLGGHCMDLVGWSDKGYLVQNSWGEEWGDGGFCHLPYDIAHSDVCYDFWCIQSISVEGLEGPSELRDSLQRIFTTKKELNKNIESVVVRIGLELGLDVDEKMRKSENVSIVSKHLGIK